MGIKTGRELTSVEIKYVLRDTGGEKYGLMPGYCIFCWRIV